MVDVPLLSVCLITYNHEQFIVDSLEGIISQRTNFFFEIVISDDCSKDRTPQIIEDYSKKYPERVVNLKNDKNVGMHKNWERAIRACRGKYVALIEGDDYWLDPLKIQKQFDCLEADGSLAICCTNAKVELVNSNRNHPDYVNKAQGRYSVEDLIRDAFMPTCTVVFRRENFPEVLPKCYYKAPMADLPIHILNALHGDICYMEESTSVYRLHQSGEWGRLDQEGRMKHIFQGLICLEKILAKTNYKGIVRQAKKEALYKIALVYKQSGERVNYWLYRLRAKLAI